MKWIIDKEFHFEAGHRVWAQKLDRPDLSISTECACKHLHGHSYVVKVFVGSNKLDPQGMVTDFKNLEFVKRFLDGVLDHRFIIDIHDPNFARITGVEPQSINVNFTPLHELVSSEDPDAQLHIDSFVLVDFIPTSENICKHLKHWVQDQLGDVAKVTAVELWETKKSHCRYED